MHILDGLGLDKNANRHIISPTEESVKRHEIKRNMSKQWKETLWDRWDWSVVQNHHNAQVSIAADWLAELSNKNQR